MQSETITAAKGFLAAGVHCGIKQSGRRDLGLLVCPCGAKAAALFTTNKITAAPVTISRQHVKSARIFGVVVNSGNANACTGPKGLTDAGTMCAKTAAEIETKPENILVASTGIIGEPLPIDKIASGISEAARSVSASAGAGRNFARAIMTTDRRPRQSLRAIRLAGRPVTIAAVAKGAGMIAPHMATTLCFITTDAAISKPLLKCALKNAIGHSLNKLTIDGHQSTNDTAVLLASGLAENPVIDSRNRQYERFADSLAEVCDELARQMALDAEGATRMFKVVVEGAATMADAARACRAVADYPLVKCAVHGSDPNWGRILCAAGAANVRLDVRKLSCKIGKQTVFRNGTAQKFDIAKARRTVAQPSHTITIDLAAGSYSDYCYGCDLSAGYVRINAHYHT